MALFSRNKKQEETKAPAVASVSRIGTDVAHVLLKPRITEKASMNMAESVYVFDVVVNANKKEIERAIEKTYNVKPRKVSIVNVKPKEKRNMRTGKRGATTGVKKAYVYLAKGETITVT